MPSIYKKPQMSKAEAEAKMAFRRSQEALRAARLKDELDADERPGRAKYELTEAQRLGPGNKDDKEARVLNRMVRWVAGGLEYEGDPRREKVVLDFGRRERNPSRRLGAR